MLKLKKLQKSYYCIKKEARKPLSVKSIYINPDKPEPKLSAKSKKTED